MLPMAPLPHMWGIIVGVYVAALVVAIHGLLRRENALLCESLVLLTILGRACLAITMAEVMITVSFLKVFIFLRGDLDGMYYAESSTSSVLDLPFSADWFFKGDVEQIVGFLRENQSTKLFGMPGQYGELTESFRRYRIASQEGQTGMAMLLPAADAGPAGGPSGPVPERAP
jgi:hypothetical protein